MVQINEGSEAARSQVKILLTGATGFVGNPVVKRLNDEHHLKAALLSTAERNLLPDDVDSFEIGPIGEATDWGRHLEGVDIVVHMAARVHVMNDVSSDPLAEYRKTNVGGTHSLLLAAQAARIKRFVFVSTVKVNGEETQDHAYMPSDDPAPCDPYGVSKMEAEQLVLRMCSNTGIDWVILRPCLMYGPGVKANFLQLIKLAFRRLPVPLCGINNRRALLNVLNFADLIASVVEHDRPLNGVFMACDHTASTSELYHSLCLGLGVPDRSFYVPGRFMSATLRVLRRQAFFQRLWGDLEIDNSQTLEKLHWNPPYSFEEGINQVAEWYRNKQS